MVNAVAKYQKYAEYKDSGVEWLGEIPSYWKLVKLSYKLKLLSGDGITALDIEETGSYPVYGGNGVRGFTEKYNCDGSYPLIGRQGALCGNINVANGKFFATEHAVVVYPYEKFNLTFLAEFLRFMDLGQYSVSAAQPGIAVDRINTLPIVVPPLEEQNSIGDFLDHETAKIDSLIEKQQKLIELLKEKRQAVISHAVTKGLNPDVAMKDSGVEWLGEVPEHWSVTKIGFHSLKIGSGKTPKGGAEIYQDEGVLFLRSQNVYNNGLRIDNSESVYISEAIHDDMSTSKVYSGDILLNITGGSIGRSSLVPDNFPEANVNQHVCIIRVRKYLQEFLALVIQSDLIQAQLRSIQTGGNREGLNFEQISKFWFALPSKEEQLRIISYIRNKLDEFSELEAKANSAIQLMQERRTALISSAVTGKIDVRHWQNPQQDLAV